MTINRKSVKVGLVTLGLVGLAGGGVAWAATDPGSAAPSSSSSTERYGADGYRMYGTYSPMTAVAKYLGLSRADLINEMHSGKSLADIAKARGKPVSGLKATMINAMKRNLAADTSLTDAQRKAILAEMKDNLDAMVNGDMYGMDMADDMGNGMMGGWGSAMMGG